MLASNYARSPSHMTWPVTPAPSVFWSVRQGVVTGENREAALRINHSPSPYPSFITLLDRVVSYSNALSLEPLKTVANIEISTYS